MDLFSTYTIFITKYRVKAMRISSEARAKELAIKLAGQEGILEVEQLNRDYTQESSNYILRFGTLYIEAYRIEMQAITTKE